MYTQYYNDMLGVPGKPQYAKDLLDNKPIIDQDFSSKYFEADAYNCIPAYTERIGKTSWYNKYGFEVKRVVNIMHEDEYGRLISQECITTTRENGIIKIEKNSSKEEVTLFDVGLKLLPEYDKNTKEYVNKIGDKLVKSTINNYLPEVIQEVPINEPAIVACNINAAFRVIDPGEATTKLSDQEIIDKFNEYTSGLRKFNDSEINSYLDNKLEELKGAIKRERPLIPYKIKIKQLEDENIKLQSRNEYLENEMKKTVRNAAEAFKAEILQRFNSSESDTSRSGR